MGSEKQYRILVAEDDVAFLDALTSLLAADGRFEVVGRARNGLDAVDLAGSLHVDAVVMDIEMPVCDGVEATRLLQASMPDVPVIAISGHDYEERVFEIRQAGAVDYVRKSRVEQELPAALAALVGAPDEHDVESESRRWDSNPRPIHYK